MGFFEKLIYGTSPDEYKPTPAKTPEGLDEAIADQNTRASQLSGETYMKGTGGFLTGQTGDPVRDALIQRQKDMSGHEYAKLSRQMSDQALRDKLGLKQQAIKNTRIQREFSRKAQIMMEDWEAQKEAARNRAISSIIGGAFTVGGYMAAGPMGGAAATKTAAPSGPSMSNNISLDQSNDLEMPEYGSSWKE